MVYRDPASFKNSDLITLDKQTNKITTVYRFDGSAVKDIIFNLGDVTNLKIGFYASAPANGLWLTALEIGYAKSLDLPAIKNKYPGDMETTEILGFHSFVSDILGNVESRHRYAPTGHASKYIDLFTPWKPSLDKNKNAPAEKGFLPPIDLRGRRPLRTHAVRCLPAWGFRQPCGALPHQLFSMPWTPDPISSATQPYPASSPSGPCSSIICSIACRPPT